jgi:hypothetical protein
VGLLTRYLFAAQARTKNEKTSPEIADWVREAIQLKRYFIRTEESYVTWIKPHRQEQWRTPWTSAQGVPKNVSYNS